MKISGIVNKFKREKKSLISQEINKRKKGELKNKIVSFGNKVKKAQGYTKTHIDQYKKAIDEKQKKQIKKLSQKNKLLRLKQYNEKLKQQQKKKGPFQVEGKSFYDDDDKDRNTPFSMGGKGFV